MVLSSSDAIALAGSMEKDARIEWARLRPFVRYARGKQRGPWLPDNVESEYRDIARKSATNWLDLVLKAQVEVLDAIGYGDSENDASPLWDLAWQANAFDAKQDFLYEATFVCGYSYVIVMPGAEPETVWMAPESATNLYAVYDDPTDEWPSVALRMVAKNRVEVYDGEARYTIVGENTARTVTVLEHELGVPPVVRIRNNYDLLGPPMGDVEPIMPVQDRIVDATFTLQMVAKYGAFPQRWIAGLNPGEPLRDADGAVVVDADGKPTFPTIKAYIDHILMAADPDTKFGQFAAADLSQYVEALEAHIRHLAAVTQTPPHYLLGSLVNLSAEALAAAEAGLQRKIARKRRVLGEGLEQMLRLAARVLGDEAAAQDTSSQIRWRDVESRSLAQTSDALLKLSQLGVPVKVLLKMIPGFSQQDVEEASRLIDEGGALDRLVNELGRPNVPNEMPAVMPNGTFA